MKWQFLAFSILVHALLFSGLSLRFSSQPIVPLGETLEVQFTESASKKESAPKPRAPKLTKTQKVATSEPKLKTKPQEATKAASSSASNKVYGSRNGVRVDAKTRYQVELEAYINSKLVYPNSAKRLNQQGRVELTFNIEPDGAFSNIKVIKASRLEKFNRAALKLMRQAQAFKPPPSGLYGPNHRFSLPLEYRSR